MNQTLLQNNIAYELFNLCNNDSSLIAPSLYVAKRLVAFLLLTNGRVKHRQTLDVQLELNSIGQIDIYKIQFLFYNVLFNSEIYLILCRICFTAVLKSTICDLEEDLSQ